MIKIQDVCHDTLFHANREGEGGGADWEKNLPRIEPRFAASESNII